MTEDLRIVLSSVLEVFGLVAAAWLYSRRLRPDLASTLRLAMHVFVPALAFTAIVEADLELAVLRDAAGATTLQIGTGLLAGTLFLRLLGLWGRRELLLPIAFVNSANLPFPLLLANFGPEGLSIGVLCYTVTNIAIFSAGALIVHAGPRASQALREPTLWAALAAVAIRAARIEVPDPVLRIPRLAGSAAVPLMLVLFGDALARARLRSLREAAVATLLRYGSGAAALALTLHLLRPEGLLRQVLILYALLPSAVVNVVLAGKAGRSEEAVAAAVLLSTLVSVAVIPLVLAFAR
jgi:predicted permease